MNFPVPKPMTHQSPLSADLFSAFLPVLFPISEINIGIGYIQSSGFYGKPEHLGAVFRQIEIQTLAHHFCSTAHMTFIAK
ncbi:hypothetical protein Cflav_PD4339 [Pedosphaera parvula Ellin514]|uniref:Uncharacterized protein n=1 Tax=Pedosphaera parvula (strain Ellin514) TaxID=320771 RepID=B9XFF4_PEDPL|nr:hypothetical protein Cflav_PD4339 [Pedosphaera parvula Ellin514]